ncbi:hypothetical protein HZH68_016163 [Vespula germanica]|uniref:Uncharacterized protein n=1 Tax=Vespula germanica TaxID=30212 RepID=A0A834MSG9_VESGE|nr:hypothetical protein HZH68_016163 [Vespula germanica]
MDSRDNRQLPLTLHYRLFICKIKYRSLERRSNVEITFAERRRWLDNVDSLQRNPRTATHPIKMRMALYIKRNGSHDTPCNTAILWERLRGVLPTTFGNDINRTHENLVKTIDTAIETFQEKVNPILRDVLDLANKMKQEGQDRMESLRSKMEDVLSNLDDDVNEIMKRIVNEVDVTECKNMVQRIKEIGLTILVNAGHCVVDKIDQASGYIGNINTTSHEVVKSLLKINEEGTECTKNSRHLLSSLACLNLAMTRATIAISTKIPIAIVDVTKMASLVSTLFPSLALCSAASTVAVFLNEANVVVSSIEACVNERASAYYATVPNGSYVHV